MRTIFCHVEEPSMEVAMQSLLPRMIAGRAAWRIINHGSKDQLLKKLPERLAGYQGMARAMDIGVLVLVDRDDDDCLELKRRLERMASEKRMPTKSRPAHDGRFLVVNRIVAEELESWFFDDLAAVRGSYP